MEEQQKEQQPQEQELKKSSFNYDKYYKLFFFIPLILLLLSLTYIGIFYSKTGDIIYKDVSLSGGTSITVNGEINQEQIEFQLKEKFPDVSFTKLTEAATGKQIALMVESSASRKN